MVYDGCVGSEMCRRDRYLLFVDIISWTIRGSAVGFLVAALLTMVHPFGGNLLYAVVGLAGAVGLVVGGTLDLLDAQPLGMNPVLLFLFAAWHLSLIPI